MKKILLITLLLPLQLMAQEKPFGKYIADVKSFNYGNWKVKEDDTITMKSGEKAVVKRILKYSQDEIEDYVFYTKLKIGEKTDTYNFSNEVQNDNIILPNGIEKIADELKELKDSYTASNGITYSVGDSVLLGYGSTPNGSYQYITLGGALAVMSYNSNAGAHQLDVSKGLGGLKLPIIKIKRYKYLGQNKTYFVVKAAIGRCNLSIEDAIKLCEVNPCNDNKGGTVIQQTSSADEIVKFKKLMDEGIITKEEFEMKKQQLLAR